MKVLRETLIAGVRSQFVRAKPTIRPTTADARPPMIIDNDESPTTWRDACFIAKTARRARLLVPAEGGHADGAASQKRMVRRTPRTPDQEIRCRRRRCLMVGRTTELQTALERDRRVCTRAVTKPTTGAVTPWVRSGRTRRRGRPPARGRADAASSGSCRRGSWSSAR